MNYYANWYANYQETLSACPLPFWKFVTTLQEMYIPSESPDLVQIYKKYFEDHTLERDHRLSPELRLFLEGIPNGFCRPVRPMLGAKARIYLSTYAMIAQDCREEWYEGIWDLLVTKRKRLLNLPENDCLDSRHIFERVHILLCWIYQTRIDELDL